MQTKKRRVHDDTDSSSEESKDEDGNGKKNKGSREETEKHKNTPPKSGGRTPQDLHSPPLAGREEKHSVTPLTNQSSPTKSTTPTGLRPMDYSAIKEYIVNKLFKEVKFITTDKQLYFENKIAQDVLAGTQCAP